MNRYFLDECFVKLKKKITIKGFPNLFKNQNDRVFQLYMVLIKLIICLQ